MRLVANVLCVLLVAAVASARAAPRHVSETPQRKLAAAEFKRGKAMYADGDYAGALAAFENGFSTYPLRAFLINIGQCLRRLGKLKEAAARYEEFLDGKDVSPTLRAEVEEALAEVRTALQQQAEIEKSEVERPAATAKASVSPAQETSSGANLSSETTVTKSRPEKKKVKPWVWAVVGVSAAVVVVGVGLGVGLGLSSRPSGGSLGILDGRTR